MYLTPGFNDPLYKGILPDIRSLLSIPNFPNMINTTKIVRPSQIHNFNEREKMSQDGKRKECIFCQINYFLMIYN